MSCTAQPHLNLAQRDTFAFLARPSYLSVFSCSAARRVYRGVAFQVVSHQEREREQMLQSILHDEIRYRNELRHGINRYVTALAGTLSKEQHQTLFQNIEQVLACVIKVMNTHSSSYNVSHHCFMYVS